MQTTTQFWRDPAMPYAESRRACNSTACYKPHSHPTFSIGAIDQGYSHFTGAPEGVLQLTPGTLVLVPSDRVHACNPVPGYHWNYQMLHLDTQWLADVRRRSYATHTLTPDQSARKPLSCARNQRERFQETTEPVRLIHNKALYEQFCSVNHLLFSAADTATKEHALIELVHACDTTPDSRSIQRNTPTLRVQEGINLALNTLQHHPAVDLSLNDLARHTHLSRYQLIRAFRAVTGMTPHAWQLNQRVNLARNKIRSGEELAHIAYDLGFADQAHFQRVFKAYTGTTPGLFRQ